MPERKIAGLVDEWHRARMAEMPDDGGSLDGSGVSVSTQIGSHAPSPLQGGSFPLPCGPVARRLPPSAGPAA